MLVSVAGAMHTAGCAGRERDEEEGIDVPIGLAPDARSVMVFRGDGSPSRWDDLVDTASGADVILVGENHGHPLGLASAAALWDDVLQRSRTGASPALAMEFFERDEQDALDDYLAGITDEAAFRKAAGRSAGNYPAGHRAMVEAAKAAGVPVIAANAPRRYVRIARTDGYERLTTLTAEQRRLFRIPDSVPTGAYRDRFNQVMSPDSTPAAEKAAHGDEPSAADFSRLDPIFRSQSMWDWTMAESIQRGLEAGRRPVLLVVGRFHVDLEGGTILALRQLRPSARVVTVSFVDAHAWSMPEEDKGRGDFVVYVGKGEE